MNKLLKLPKIGLKNKKKQSLSIETSTEPSVLLPKAQDIQSASSLRRTCSEVSVACFKKAHCKNDKSGLIISGTPTPDELQSAWEEIIFEYSGLVTNDTGNALQEIIRQIGEFNAHIKYVENATRLLRYRIENNQLIRKDIIEELLHLGYYGDYNPENKTAFLAQLKRVDSLLKTKLFDKEVLEDEYLRLSKTIEGKKQTEEDFVKNIVMLKKWGYKIDLNETMMDEYAQAMNLYIKETNKKQ